MTKITTMLSLNLVMGQMRCNHITEAGVPSAHKFCLSQNCRLSSSSSGISRSSLKKRQHLHRGCLFVSLSISQTQCKLKWQAPRANKGGRDCWCLREKRRRKKKRGKKRKKKKREKTRINFPLQKDTVVWLGNDLAGSERAPDARRGCLTPN